MFEDDEIADVRVSEEARGKKPVDPEERRRQRRFEADILRAFKIGDPRVLQAAITRAGRHGQEPEVVKIWKLWRQTVRP